MTRTLCMAISTLVLFFAVFTNPADAFPLVWKMDTGSFTPGIAQNQEARFAYPFSPDPAGGIHWYNALERAPDCCWTQKMYAEILQKGPGAWKEYINTYVEHGRPYGLVDALAYHNPFSREKADMLLAHTLIKSGERSLQLAKHDESKDYSGRLVVSYLREDARRYFQLAEALLSQSRQHRSPEAP